jgi:hypothetical protein
LGAGHRPLGHIRRDVRSSEVHLKTRRSIEARQPRSASLDPDVSAETSSRTPQQQRIEAQRAQLLQAHGVLKCLYEVLLHAECDDAVSTRRRRMSQRI